MTKAAVLVAASAAAAVAAGCLQQRRQQLRRKQQRLQQHVLQQQQAAAGASRSSKEVSGSHARSQKRTTALGWLSTTTVSPVRKPLVSGSACAAQRWGMPVWLALLKNGRLTPRCRQSGSGCRYRQRLCSSSQQVP